MLAGPHSPAVLKRDATVVGEGHCACTDQGDISILHPDGVRFKVDVQFLTRPMQANVHIFT